MRRMRHVAARRIFIQHQNLIAMTRKQHGGCCPRAPRAHDNYIKHDSNSIAAMENSGKRHHGFDFLNIAPAFAR